MKREDASALAIVEPTARDLIAFLDAHSARVEIEMPGLCGVIEREADKWVSYTRRTAEGVITSATFHECETMNEALVHLAEDCR